MGPLKLARNVAVGLEWAHFTYLQMLPLALDGPILASYKSCHSPWMGPFHLPTNVVVGFGWAHCSFLQKLPFPLNGPISPTYKCCWWPGMGPLELPMNVALALEWSHCRCLESCPWMCPVQLGRNVAVGNGCAFSYKRNWGWPRIGPFSCMRKVVDGLELAHSHTWRNLPVTSNRPNIGTGKNCRWPWMGPFKFMRKTTDYCKWAH